MNYEVIFFPKAEETYNLLITQLMERWGERFVIKLEDKLTKAIKAISANPYMYAIANESTGVRKCVLHKNCSLFYKVYGNTIQIVWFWDNRQDPLLTL